MIRRSVSYIRVILFACLLMVTGCGGGDNVQMPDEPDPMPESGPAPAQVENPPTPSLPD